MTSEYEDDLRTLAEELAADAERLKEIERQKADLDPHDPRLRELAAESSDIAERLRASAKAEEVLVDEASRERDDDTLT